MKKNAILPFLLLLACYSTSLSQKNEKTTRYFSDPVLTDSLSTIFLPTRYNEEFFSSNKIALWGEYYANIVVYDYSKDTYHKLFATDTYIEAFRDNSRSRYSTTPEKLKNVSKDWVFLLVKNQDYNNSGRIDEDDPSILYVTSTKGQGLKPITKQSDNVVSFEIFDEQEFAFLKIQRDANNDRSFKNDDKDYYFVKLNLNDLTLGKEIEIK